VPDFLPFPAVRYAAGTDAVEHAVEAVADLSAVCAPPYDVIDSELRAALAALDPRNAVRLILPDSYADAAATFARWQAEGALATDAEATFSIYRMEFAGDDGAAQQTTGVIGALALDREHGAVLPHERTLPKAKTDRLELLRATRANFDPIWGLSLARGLTEMLEPTGPPLAEARAEDGSRHTLWRIDDPDRTRAIADAVTSSLLVLADGHHRYETARNYRAERSAGGVPDPGAQAIMTLVVELAAEQLCVQAIHRLLMGVGDTDLRAALAPSFVVHDAGTNRPERVVALEAAMHEQGGLGLVDRDGLALLVPRAALDARMLELPAELQTVDSARFEVGVVPACPDVSLDYRNDARTVAGLVANGRADAAVLLRPVTVETIRAAAAADLRMPEKTTFFAPKPRTGMVFRRLDP
jgi:uncharacterized protein (DUF1015 family)